MPYIVFNARSLTRDERARESRSIKNGRVFMARAITNIYAEIVYKGMASLRATQYPPFYSCSKICKRQTKL